MATHFERVIPNEPEGLEGPGGIHGYIAQSSQPATVVDLVYLRAFIDQLRPLPRHAHG